MYPLDKKISYLNVDLDLVSREDLAPLLQELSAATVDLYHERKGGYSKAGLEVNSNDKTCEATLKKFCDLLEGVSPMSKRIWNRCRIRNFSIGFESGLEPHALCSKISNRTLSRISKLNASLDITIYRYAEGEGQRKP